MSTSNPPRSPAFRSGRKRTLVSLTPLIDVVFILLVFFMLVSSFADWRTITLAPPVAASGQSPGFSGAVLVDVRGGGDVRLSGETMTLDELADRAAIMLADKADRRFIVKTGEAVPLQDLVDVLDHLALAGATAVSFVRQEGTG